MTIQNNEELKVVQEINMPDSVVAVNVFYFRTAFSVAQQEADILDSLETWIEALFTTLLAEVSDLLTLGDMTMYSYDTVAMQWDNEGTRTPSVTFANTSEMLPHGVSALVRAYTVNARIIARKYLAGFGETSQADGTWIATTLTHLADFGAAWDDVEVISSGNELRPAVFSTKFGSAWLLSGTEVVLADPAYQRRRRPGVGS